MRVIALTAIGVIVIGLIILGLHIRNTFFQPEPAQLPPNKYTGAIPSAPFVVKESDRIRLARFKAQREREAQQEEQQRILKEEQDTIAYNFFRTKAIKHIGTICLTSKLTYLSVDVDKQSARGEIEWLNGVYEIKLTMSYRGTLLDYDLEPL